MGQINIIGIIGVDVTADEVIAEINSYKPEDRLNVFVLSNGGDVDQGFEIYNALDRHPGPVAVHVDRADSIAASFSQAGTPGLRTMAANGEIMVHLPMFKEALMVNELDLEKMKDFLQIQKSRLISTLRPTGISEKKLGEMLENETFLDAKAAKALGFIDEIVQESKVVAMFKFLKSIAQNPEEKQIHAEATPKTLAEMLEEVTAAGITEETIVNALAQILESARAQTEPVKAPEETAATDDPEKKPVETAAVADDPEVKALFVEKFLNDGKLTKAMLPWCESQTVAQLKAWGKTAPKAVAISPVRPDFDAVKAPVAPVMAGAKTSVEGTNHIVQYDTQTKKKTS